MKRLALKWDSAARELTRRSRRLCLALCSMVKRLVTIFLGRTQKRISNATASKRARGNRSRRFERRGTHFVDSKSNNSILIIKGANSYLAPADIDAAADKIRASDLVIMQLEVIGNSVYTIEFAEKRRSPSSSTRTCESFPTFQGSLRCLSLFQTKTELQTLTGMPQAIWRK